MLLLPVVSQNHSLNDQTTIPGWKTKQGMQQENSKQMTD